MKKSQLRNIIKESIKELLTEQSGPGPNCVTTITTPPMQSWSYHCSGYCDWDFAQMCCQNTNNQPYTAPSSNGWATLIGIGGQTVPCATCTPSTIPTGYWRIPADDIVAIAIQYGQVNTNAFGGVINPSSTYPTMFPAGYWFGIWDSTQGSNQVCNSFMSSPPTPLVAGCTVSGSSNYDMYADGCEVNGVVDPNDVTCCAPIQPGGGVTPPNVGQQNVDYLNLQIADPITPTPNPNDPQMKRMKDLAFRGKR